MAQTNQPATAAELHALLIQFQMEATATLTGHAAVHHYMWVGCICVQVVFFGIRLAVWTLLETGAVEPFVTDSAVEAEQQLQALLGITATEQVAA